jgi:hypothetical protein
VEQAYQKARTADPSYKAAAEFLAIVLTDLGTSLKLAGNTEDGIQKYCEALEVDSHYAVNSTLSPYLSLLYFFILFSVVLMYPSDFCSLLITTLEWFIQR